MFIQTFMNMTKPMPPPIAIAIVRLLPARIKVIAPQAAAEDEGAMTTARTRPYLQRPAGDRQPQEGRHDEPRHGPTIRNPTNLSRDLLGAEQHHVVEEPEQDREHGAPPNHQSALGIRFGTTFPLPSPRRAPYMKLTLTRLKK
jgi:hypothetical protein